VGNVDCSINRLDEELHTLVVLDDEKGSNLFVGGGPSGIVVALSDDKEHLIARRGNDAEPISIVVGGQAGDYRKRNVLSLEQAKYIARAYFEGVDIRTLGLGRELKTARRIRFQRNADQSSAIRFSDYGITVTVYSIHN
jgi:hypothetical protein